MPLITPYSPSDLGQKCEVINVAWKLAGVRTGTSEQVARHSTANTQNNLWSTSMIECRHPEGKLWRSMFIPITASGGSGMSITWWGKDDQVKGQAQCKIVSETEWYSVVKSKAVAKGYDVETYIGRSIPLQVGHNFVKELSENSSLPQLPQLAFTPDQASNLFAQGQGDKIGATIGKALSNILPTNNFFTNINGKGHSLGALMSEGLSNAMTTSEKDVIAGLMRELTGDLKPIEGIKKAPEPQIDREEVYGSGWGAFG
ncbi:hypothetical protein CNR34_00057 [Pseudomonas phage nickie]|uniref:Uncharacterized protein n=1 Tax=Pseudomonas phage nickie TaxID=2048977 RepID=A0A2H4P7H7_9CAUD|nr:hypothetical protein FDJ16_gp108 [Pseudomonas phage nickie]ATW57990.1 hypothetical protein CNR34_00057 [Pseudomonas phage nickie]